LIFIFYYCALRFLNFHGIFGRNFCNLGLFPDLGSPLHVRQYQLRCTLASLHAAATQFPYFFAQLRTVARLSDINEQISKLRYLAVYVLDLLKRTKSETRDRAPSIIPVETPDSRVLQRGNNAPLVTIVIIFSHQYFSHRAFSRPHARPNTD